jgi:hypothetical protein
MACPNCKRCVGSPVAVGGRRFARGYLALGTLGLSELVLAMRRKCRLCGHQMSLHAQA